MTIDVMGFLKSFGADALFANFLHGLGINVFPHGASPAAAIQAAGGLHASGSEKFVDEILFATAAYHVLYKNGTKIDKREKQKIMKVWRVFCKYDSKRRSQIVKELGFNEVGVADPKNPNSISYNNERGQKIFRLLMDLDKDEIPVFLKANHITDTALDEIKETIVEINQFAEKAVEHFIGGPKDLKNFQRRAKSFRQRQKLLLSRA
jgi:hypothetical protein